MGVHVSFVRSTVLDRWTPDQLLFMVAGGNSNAATFFKAKGWVDSSAGASDASTAAQNEKYLSKAAVAYKAHLEKEITLVLLHSFFSLLAFVSIHRLITHLSRMLL